MIFKHFRYFQYLSAVLALAAAPALASVDDHVLGAFDAYRAGDPMKLAKHAKKVSMSASVATSPSPLKSARHRRTTISG